MKCRNWLPGADNDREYSSEIKRIKPGVNRDCWWFSLNYPGVPPEADQCSAPPLAWKVYPPPEGSTFKPLRAGINPAPTHEAHAKK